MKWVHQNDFDEATGLPAERARVFFGPEPPASILELPGTEKREVPDHEYIPIVNLRRVRGWAYTPYQGDSYFALRANELLASIAQGNFQNR